MGAVGCPQNVPKVAFPFKKHPVPGGRSFIKKIIIPIICLCFKQWFSGILYRLKNGISELKALLFVPEVH